MVSSTIFFFFFFFNDTATTEIYTLSLHDALPISLWFTSLGAVKTSTSRRRCMIVPVMTPSAPTPGGDRKSTRLNSSHLVISYAVFCLKKKKYTASPDRSGTYDVRAHLPYPTTRRL